MNFTTSLRSELLKVRRTSVVYLIVAAAFVIPFILVFDHGVPDPNDPPTGANYYREGLMVFVFAFLQLFFVLGSTLVMQIEVRNNAWKQVLTSPQSYFNILLSKFVVIQLLALAFIAVFNGFMLLSAGLLDVVYGLDYLAYCRQWPEIVKMNLLAFISTIGISAVTFWLALRSKNFVAPVAIGFLLWLIGPIAAFELQWPYMHMYVSALPFTVLSKRFENEPVFHQLLSLGYGVFFFLIAYVEFCLRRVSLKVMLGH